MRSVVVVFVGLSVGCSIAPLGNIHDAGSKIDAGVVDAGTPRDAGFAPLDAQSVDPEDAGVSRDGAIIEDASAPTTPDASVQVTFDYQPSNFDPTDFAFAPLNISQDMTCIFDTTTMAFAAACVPDAVAVQLLGAGTPDEVVLVETGDLTIDGQLIVEGSRPLIIAIYGEGDIDGLVSVAASGSTPGPGADRGPCAAGGAGGDGTSVQTPPGAGGGGGGGGYGTQGGRGGSGLTGAGRPGSRGDANGPPEIVPLRGGCTGGIGAVRNGAVGLGGGGGGAIQISAATDLKIEGRIVALGGGGQTGGANAGGGGGGSGGAILLEGLRIEFGRSSVLVANGGGGGGGNGNGANALPGEDGRLDATPAAGGAPDDDGARGGDGSGGGLDPANGQSAPFGGGGGGGGGAGRIRLNANRCDDVNDALISPLPTGC